MVFNRGLGYVYGGNWKRNEKFIDVKCKCLSDKFEYEIMIEIDDEKVDYNENYNLVCYGIHQVELEEKKTLNG